MHNKLRDHTIMLERLCRVLQCLLESFAENLCLLECGTVSVSFVAFMQSLIRSPSIRASRIGTRELQRWKPR
jgi:hypothetical protein